jgi:hypothetical protein
MYCVKTLTCVKILGQTKLCDKWAYCTFCCSDEIRLPLRFEPRTPRRKKICYDSMWRNWRYQNCHLHKLCTGEVQSNPTLRRQCLRDGYFFWRSKHFNQYLCMRWYFSRPFKSFSLSYTIISFLFSSLILHTNFENVCWTLLRIPFSVIGRCSLEPTSHWCGKMCEN